MRIASSENAHHGKGVAPGPSSWMGDNGSQQITQITQITKSVKSVKSVDDKKNTRCTRFNQTIHCASRLVHLVRPVIMTKKSVKSVKSVDKEGRKQ